MSDLLQATWRELPDDIEAATIEVKRTLRACAGDVGRLFRQIDEVMARRVDELVELDARGQCVWPEIDYDAIARDAVPARLIDLIHRRGCVVVRGQVNRQTALDWDQALLDYVDSNHFDEAYKGPADTFFGRSKPEIYPIYWSPSQMQARQHPHTAKVQAFLNGLWENTSQGRTWFDSEHSVIYPDRVRRRPPGTRSGGLHPHLDGGSIERWFTPAYRRVYAALFNGDFAAHDAWDGAWRPAMEEYPSPTRCSIFRSFQGWLALSRMQHEQGVLHVVPIPEAVCYLLIRPLLDDVPETSLCGSSYGHAMEANAAWHKRLLPAVLPLPDIEPGDSVWWHADLIHSVAPVENQQGWGNVIYIPAAPTCDKNLAYARDAYDRFCKGESPRDFPQEHYEKDWPNRFPEAALDEQGRRAFGQA